MLTEEQLKERKKGIGGSDVGGILGVSKFKTPLAVYMDKVEDIKDSELNTKEWIKWGNALEAPIALEFASRTQKRVRRRNSIIKDKEQPFLLANIDRWVENENSGLEIKNINAFAIDEWKENPPIEYIMQCMHYIDICKANSWYLAVLIGGSRYFQYKIDRDEELIKKIRSSAIDFWNLHIIPKKPPFAINGDDFDLLEKLNPKNDNLITLADEFNFSLENYKEYSKTIKELKEKQELIKAQIYQELKGGNGETSKYKINFSNIIQNRIDQNRIGQNKLKDQYKDVYEKCLTESNYLRFNIKEI